MRVIILIAVVLLLLPAVLASAADVYCAIVSDSDYWDGTIAWGYDATSSVTSPTAHANQTARDAQYTATYSSLWAWEDARDGVAQAGDTEYAIIQGPWVNPDTTSWICEDFASDAIIIRAIGVARCNGIWDDTDAYTLEVASEDDSYGVRVASNDPTTFDGLQFHDDSITATTGFCVEFHGTGTYTLSNSFLSTMGAANAVEIDAASTTTIFNCIIINRHTRLSGGEAIHAVGGSTVYVYTTLACNFDDAFEDSGATTTAISCVAIDCVDDFDSWDTITTCATDQGAGEGTSGVDISATWDSTCFTDHSVYNYNVQDTDSPLYDTGTDSSGVFTVDVTNYTRPRWDLGPFEYQAAAGGNIAKTAGIAWASIKKIAGASQANIKKIGSIAP